MKLGIFSDPHFSSAEITHGKRYNSRALLRMEQALRFFQQQGCDRILCLGDLIDKEGDHPKEIRNLQKIAAVFAECPIPITALMGNHDAFCFTVEEFYAVLGEQYRPRNLCGEKNLLFLDACHFKTGAHYQPGDSDWTDTFLPEAEDLPALLAGLSGDAFIFIHQNIDPAIPENHCLSNAAAVREMLRRSGKVRAVFQGHYHAGKESAVDGISYITLPALCEQEEAYFIFTI